MNKEKCKIGETAFVDEKTAGSGHVLNGYWEKHKGELKIKSNVFQCKGGKEMKGDVYGIK